MVLLAAAVCTKNGKALLSRQFVEMTKAHIEGLLAAFPKLMPSGVRQHTFVETDSVRYVYQPMEKLYMLLITTKMSNILEDLETLHLFARVIPEYCRTLDESDILENAFQIVFAFDEIVALGYRESVNLSQIRTFVEMYSHEEKVYQAVRQTQEREAKQKMKEKAKELQRQKMEANKRGGRPNVSVVGGYTGGFTGSLSADSLPTPAEPPKPTYNHSIKPMNNSKAMKLGGKSKDVDSFVDQLKSEGETVAATSAIKSDVGPDKPLVPQTQIKTESVHVSFEEKLTISASRSGRLDSMELEGMLSLRISDESLGRIKLALKGPKNKSIVLMTHPSIDKELLKAKTQVALRNPAKPFPINTDVGVLKWRFNTQDEALIPLSINCWPASNGQNGCDVNIEYQLEVESLELQNVAITIPLSYACGDPVVSECDGDYTYEKRGILLWQLPVIDASNKSGSLAFSCSGGCPDDFFPVKVSFFSKKMYSEIDVLDVLDFDSEQPVKYSSDGVLVTEKYEIE